MSATPLITLDPKLVDSLVREHLYAAVLSVLADKKEALLSQMAAQVLNLKVNEHGNVSSYSSENKFTWIELTLNRELREIIKQSCVESLALMKPEIEAAVKKEIRKSGGAIVKAIMLGFTESLKFDWNFKCNLVTKD